MIFCVSVCVIWYSLFYSTCYQYFKTVLYYKNSQLKHTLNGGQLRKSLWIHLFSGLILGRTA